jgi:hypothetical protein
MSIYLSKNNEIEDFTMQFYTYSYSLASFLIVKMTLVNKV